jgi:GntR family transcriptional regulator
MKVDHNSGIPLYIQIESILRSDIESGKYDDGSYLPREENLAKILGVSRNTVRQGISKLVNDGLLKRTRGKGTVVVSKTITTQLAEWHSFRNEMLDKGIKLKNYYSYAEMVTAPTEVYKKLNTGQHKKLMKLERLHGDEYNPFVFFISWFHPGTGITENEDFSIPLYTILEDKYSVKPAYSEEELFAIEAKEPISGYLQIEENKPILFRKRVVLDTDSRPIEYNLGYYRSDKFRYSIRFERKL